MSRHNENVVKLKHYIRIGLHMTLNNYFSGKEFKPAINLIYVQSSNFPFSVFGGEKDRFSFILPKMNAGFPMYKPVTYIGEVFREFFFYLLQIFMLK